VAKRTAKPSFLKTSVRWTNSLAALLSLAPTLRLSPSQPVRMRKRVQRAHQPRQGLAIKAPRQKRYYKGMAVPMLAKGGLMHQAALAGQSYVFSKQ
jgi:uncharacterized protein YcaQ